MSPWSHPPPCRARGWPICDAHHGRAVCERVMISQGPVPAARLGLCRMPDAMAETARPSTGAAAPTLRRARPWGGRPRLGIGWRLILGLTAVAAVLIAGEVLATRTTREALDAVRSMQNEHEPLASAANLVLEKLIAYDRAVGEHVQTHSAADFTAINAAGATLENALAAYFRNAGASPVSRAAAGLRAQLIRHIAVARQLASRAAQRLQWVDERQAALTRVYERIAAAGGSGLAINGTQVVARRSLSELESAINSVRGNFDTSAVITRRERDFMAVLDAHDDEFEASPGHAWLSLVRHDFQTAARLRLQIERYDEQSGAEWHSLLEDSAALTGGVQDQLQRPARAGLLLAAQHALASVLLVGSISLPVRRLTAATRQFAGGDRAARARRGGSAEIDELAESFNTMADRIASAESELRAHQAELERHVAERTRQLHHLAHHDPLTQLPNRRQLSARLGAALSRAATSGQRIALLFVDVDNFKSINDTLGHNFGDRVLQGIARRLQAASA